MDKTYNPMEHWIPQMMRNVWRQIDEAAAQEAESKAEIQKLLDGLADPNMAYPSRDKWDGVQVTSEHPSEKFAINVAKERKRYGVDGSQAYPHMVSGSQIVTAATSVLAVPSDNSKWEWAFRTLRREDLLDESGYIRSKSYVDGIRATEELRLLIRVLSQANEYVGIIDGSLSPWTEFGVDFTAGEFRKAFLSAKDFLFSGVISRPTRKSVTNLVRKAQGRRHKEIQKMSGVDDYALMSEWLAVGERSALFEKESQGEHEEGERVLVAYMKPTPGSVLGVEIPEWCKDKADVIFASILKDSAQVGFPLVLAIADQKVRIPEKTVQDMYKRIRVQVLQKLGPKALGQRREKDRLKSK